MILDLAHLPATPVQRRNAVVVAVAIVAASLLAWPFAGRDLGPFPPFLPATLSIITGCDAITAFLLFRQFTAAGERSTGLLAFAYLITALMPIPYMLAFPFVVSTEGLFGGPQGGIVLWSIWHALFPAFLLTYVIVRGRERNAIGPLTAKPQAVQLTLTAFGFVTAVTFLVALFPERLPVLIVARTYQPAFEVIGIAEWLFTAATLAFFVARTGLRSVTHLWVGIALLAFLADITMTFMAPTRFSVSWYVARGQSLVAASVVLFALLTESGRQAAIVANSQRRLSTIVDGVADALITFGADRVVLWCNDAAARMFGTAAEEVAGKPIVAWLPQYGSIDPVAGNHDRESVGRRADGSFFAVELSRTELLSADLGQATTILIARDISERKRGQEELAYARDQAVASARIKSEFLATMSHEIRTPINAIVGMTELLLETPMAETQREYARTVQSSADALLDVINAILDHSKLEAGKLEIERIEFDPVAIVEAAADIIATEAHKKKLSLDTFIDPRIPRRLWGDAARVRQVLLNLLSNAVKFTERGSVIVRVELDGEERGGQVRLHFGIEDSGIGIPLEVQARLFAPFAQADGSTSRRFGGTGLGLSISKRLIGLLGGEIGVRSDPGVGSHFWFDLPFAVQRGRVVSDPARAAIEGMRVIIVDDDPAARTILATYLSSWNIDCAAAADAHAALEVLRAAGERRAPFDVALIDMRMPERDGLWLGKQMADDPALNSVRRILVTAYEDPKATEAARSGAFGHVLRKPIRQSMLFDALAQTVAEPQTRSAAPPERSRSVRVLLAEDHPVNRTMALQQLRRLGIEADVAHDGREAVDAVQRQRYSLILMDCQMPEVDGFEATRRIRRIEARTGDHVTIVAMTANALEGDREACLAAGMDEYLAKPVRLDDLRTMLDRFLGAPS